MRTHLLFPPKEERIDDNADDFDDETTAREYANIAETLLHCCKPSPHRSAV